MISIVTPALLVAPTASAATASTTAASTTTAGKSRVMWPTHALRALGALLEQVRPFLATTV